MDLCLGKCIMQLIAGTGKKWAWLGEKISSLHRQGQPLSFLIIEDSLLNMSCLLIPKLTDNLPGGHLQSKVDQQPLRTHHGNTLSLPRYWGSSPSSLSSYSTRNPDTVSEAETHETTKLLAVISVTDSEVATTGEKGVVSPVTVLPRVTERGKRDFDHWENLLSTVEYN